MSYSSKLYIEFAKYGQVVRRGEAFLLGETSFLSKVNIEKLVFKITYTSKNTKKTITVDHTNDQFKFHLNDGFANTKLYFIPDEKLALNFYTIDVSHKEGANLKFLFSERVLVIANADNTQDEVYMESAADKKEYLYNTQTLIYTGSYHRPGPMHYSVDQFNEYTVRTAAYMLGFMSDTDKQSIAGVTRKLAEVVNANDEGGIIAGRWSEYYPDGRNPMFWTGGAEIFRKYWKTQTSVRYGQCFTFAGVFCSLARSLGIPCRVITNYNSFHDGNNNLIYDKYIDEDGYPEDAGNDSIWNFHCWNECYFRRDELLKYNVPLCDWQILDATPQERSRQSNTFTVGPCSRSCIKNGYTDSLYDAGFVYAEVNADIITVYRERVYNVDTRTVGALVCTKMIGANRLQDLTDDYKYKDKTFEDTQAKKRALQKLGYRSQASLENLSISIVVDNTDDYCFNVAADMDSWGMLVKVHHTNNVNRVVNYGKLSVVCNVYSYNGVLLCKLYKNEFALEKSVLSREGYISVKIDLGEFEKNYSEFATHVKATAVYTSYDNRNFATNEVSIPIVLPKISVKYDSVVSCGKLFKCVFLINNMFKFLSMSNIKMYVESKSNGANIKETVSVSDIRPKETAEVEKFFKIPKPGQYTFSVKLKSDNVSGMHTSFTVTVV